MSGFVYIWYDRKHKRYYIGSHWGKENDGYICSSRWMRKAYKRRPQDFKRRILSRISLSREHLYQAEEYWLSMINREQLGTRYYNLCLGRTRHWSADEQKYASITDKLSRAQKKHFSITENRERLVQQTKKCWDDPEIRQRMVKDRSKIMTGVMNSPDIQDRISNSMKEKWKDPEFRAYMMDARKKVVANG